MHNLKLNHEADHPLKILNITREEAEKHTEGKELDDTMFFMTMMVLTRKPALALILRDLTGLELDKPSRVAEYLVTQITNQETRRQLAMEVARTALEDMLRGAH